MATGSTTTIVSVVGPIPEALNGIGGARASTDIAEWAPKGAVGAEANGAQGAGVAAAVAVAAKNQVGATSIDRIISKLRLRWRLYACLYVRISAVHIRLSRGFELDYRTGDHNLIELTALTAPELRIPRSRNNSKPENPRKKPRKKP